MDLSEILSYKPVTSSKRVRDDDNDEELPPRYVMVSIMKNCINNYKNVNSKTSKGPLPSDNGEEQNGLSYEEKLRLLQSIDEEDEGMYIASFALL